MEETVDLKAVNKLIDKKFEIKSAKEKNLSQKAIIEPLMQAHLDYGKNRIRILDFLQKIRNRWVYENNELLINSESLLKEYNVIIKVLGNDEATINTLSEKLIEVM